MDNTCQVNNKVANSSKFGIDLVYITSSRNGYAPESLFFRKTNKTTLPLFTLTRLSPFLIFFFKILIDLLSLWRRFVLYRLLSVSVSLHGILFLFFLSGSLSSLQFYFFKKNCCCFFILSC